ncbi:TlpA family protein disulfide reductase [Mucilaginibacter rubeus]|uniref:TlpA family protein disulfide reductase n=1 Tax=Mucilaginibacter rubeus TaxID=2027860 RepID=A0A5C1HT92_9SPHI|nr:TlpA disulfide reductase family protein [Mucilaginibacter rubeus]QEM09102.1 TlpA family protein disulfide reductase [Mucilaginibacter rubeus]
MKKITFLIFIWFFTCVQLFATEDRVRIIGQADFLKDGDTIAVTVSPYAGRLNELKSSFAAPAKGSRFTLEIPDDDQPRFVLVRFNKPGKAELGPLLIFPGDDLDFGIRKAETLFKGPSAKRFEVQQQLAVLSARCKQEFKTVYAPEGLASSFSRIDSCTEVCQRLLEKSKSGIGRSAWEWLCNEAMAEAVTSKLGYMTYTCLNKPGAIQDRYITALRKYGRPFNSYPSFLAADSLDRPSSKFAVEMIYRQYLVDSCILTRRKFSLHDCYLYESRHFRGAMREQLVMELFMLKRNSPEISAADIEDALSYVSNSAFRQVLEKIMARSTAGAVAPDFELKDENDRLVKLSDFRGKVVILDFWFTGCGACKALAPALDALEKKYANRPVVFLSVSIDKSREQWLRTLKTNQYTSPLAVKLYTEGRGDQHQVIKDYDVHGFPTIIIVDKEGRLGPKPELDDEGLSRVIEGYL